MSTLMDALNNYVLPPLTYVGQTLDKPGAAVRGLLAGRPDQLANLVPFSDTAGLTDPSQRTSGRGLLEAYGLVGPKGPEFDWTDASGIGVELATDPLNLLGLANVGRVAKAAQGAKANNLLRDTLLAKGAMPEEIAGLTKAVDEAGNPLRTYHGTGRVFDAYDMDKMAPTSLYGPGIYTTANPEVAGEYAINKAGPTDYFVKPGREQEALAFLKQDPAFYEGWTKGLTDQQALERAAASYGEALESGGEELPDVARELFGFAPTKPNVRMHYMDVRNPFDMDASHEVAFLPSPLNEKGLNPRPALWAAKDPNYQAIQAQALMAEAEYQKAARSLMDARASGDTQGIERLQSQLLDVQVRQKEIANAMKEFEAGVSPPPGWTQTGDEIFRTLSGPFGGNEAVRLLKEAGYDSLTHIGGNRMGDVSHRVWVATDPAQIYAPWLAPAKQQVPGLARPAGLLADHNLLAALGRYNGGGSREQRGAE